VSFMWDAQRRARARGPAEPLRGPRPRRIGACRAGARRAVGPLSVLLVPVRGRWGGRGLLSQLLDLYRPGRTRHQGRSSL